MLTVTLSHTWEVGTCSLLEKKKMQSEKREKTCAQVISATEPPPSKKFEHSGPISKLKHLLDFDGSDISSFSALVSLLYSPKDPSSLGVLRIGFGRFCTIIATKLSPVK